MSSVTDGAKEAGGLIPGVYYDLIARVGSGAPLVLFFAWSLNAESDGLEKYVGEAGAVLLVLLLSYLAGLVLTAPSGIVCCVPVLLLRQLFRKQLGFGNYEMCQIGAVSKGLAFRSDSIGVWNRKAGMTLAKMSAEAILCQNLFTGVLFVLIAQWTGMLNDPMVARVPCTAKFAGMLLLLIAVIHRNFVLMFRQKGYYDLTTVSD